MVDFEKERKEVVQRLEKIGYLKDDVIKKAMLKIGREDFVTSEYKVDSYIDTPLPIPGGATISAPHMHAISLEALELKNGDKMLEVGAGSGILLAYIKEIVGEKGEVFGIEFEKETFDFAKENLKKTGYLDKVTLIHGDGSLGLPGEAPFDKILISAAAPDFPKPLVEQLKMGGIILAMIGSPGGHQELVRGRKTEEGKLKKENLGGVVFIPLKGEYGWK